MLGGEAGRLRRGPCSEGHPDNGEELHAELPLHLKVDEVERRVRDGAELIDVRPMEAFAGGHVQGSLSIALRPSFASWLGWLVAADRPVIFVLDSDQDRAELVRQSLGIGYEQLIGANTLEPSPERLERPRGANRQPAGSRT